MTNGVFQRINKFGFARAGDLMSTKSTADFEWCVKLMQTMHFNVGIASKHKRESSSICDYDQNAVLFSAHNVSKVKIGSKTIHSNLLSAKPEDVIRFRFQPEQKKLVINLVRVEKSSIFEILFQQERNVVYKIDLQDNVNYYAFIQSVGEDAIEAHLIS